jgi:hypothetical protein
VGRRDRSAWTKAPDRKRQPDLTDCQAPSSRSSNTTGHFTRAHGSPRGLRHRSSSERPAEADLEIGALLDEMHRRLRAQEASGDGSSAGIFTSFASFLAFFEAPINEDAPADGGGSGSGVSQDVEW